MSVDYFLKLDGIDGESMDDNGHKNEIDLLSWSWGETQTGTFSQGSGGGAGKVAMQDFHFVMKVNQASPLLLLKCASGEHISLGTLTCRKAGTTPQEYLKIKFTDLIVSSYQTGGSSGDEVPLDQISVNYAKIEYGYAKQKEGGGLEGMVWKGWNVQTSKAT
jgi:type VI secretion system secreted protein Hcp